ncbi:glycosyltransferase [Hyphomicrobium sp. LHD-15]|uniref:glycosyltransferase n=1 Tax=Hyphomicrobium sp. LHD-15 TaxID=3072142 RepID=UPI00280D3519|nr:glycosyltransferase [Hyphomicrobium sp. LHD-15]MDQ8697281.1 glycosyltransferase [Hyphomicrobium sp. LHD-15]
MSVTSELSYWEAFAPGLAIMFAAIALLPWLDRNSTIARSCLLAVCAGLQWRYFIWRITDTLAPVDHYVDFGFGILFLLLEFLTVVGATLSLLVLTRTKQRSSEATANGVWLASLERKPLVDVLICTYNEDEAILQRTIICAQAMSYENFRVWVCDDGKRAWLRDMCAELGCGYLTRPDNSHAKAGNINNALRYLESQEIQPDFISILDADFAVTPQFLDRVVALAKDKDVGVVQTPQHFFNPDPIQANLTSKHVWPDEQRFFFDVVLASKDAWDGAFCCGTSSLIRFAPLRDIGGFPTDSVTEDYLVTLRLGETGYRTVYLNEKLSVGLAPEGLKEYVVQRARWSLGFMQIFRGPSGPFSFGNKLKLVQRMHLVDTFLHWTATYYFRIAALIVPPLYLIFDIQAVYANVPEAISHIFPFMVAQWAVFGWLTQSRVLPILGDVSQLLAATHIVQSVTVGLLRPLGHKFNVTAKGGDRSAGFVQWSFLQIFAGYLCLNVAGILWAFALNPSRPLADASALALFWTWYNIIILVLACFVCVEGRQRRAGERFGTGENAIAVIAGGLFPINVRDISTTGLRAFGRSPAPIGSTVTIVFPDLEVHGSIARVSHRDFGVRFDNNVAQKLAIIRRLYSGRYSASVETVSPLRVSKTLAKRVFG